ncbi:hypothetical protein E2C01_102698 [Portunus trituberculatus]|uniref:Uncharacterized protein n=1 Tax=Portunus trituberculatus TaxID=210409 RepID=A0A5B7KJ58_PORTR|nr:hypothetical protein [Portunus trituberculatus]
MMAWAAAAPCRNHNKLVLAPKNGTPCLYRVEKAAFSTVTSPILKDFITKVSEVKAEFHQGSCAIDRLSGERISGILLFHKRL